MQLKRWDMHIIYKNVKEKKRSIKSLLYIKTEPVWRSHMTPHLYTFMSQ